MSGETKLVKLLENMTPKLQEGVYVFCKVSSLQGLPWDELIGVFKEEEATTIILEKSLADSLGYTYEYTAAWITLQIHSSLEAVGLTAAFSNALAAEGISCNVVAAYYHDHVFVAKKDGHRALSVLQGLKKID